MPEKALSPNSTVCRPSLNLTIIFPRTGSTDKLYDELFSGVPLIFGPGSTPDATAIASSTSLISLTALLRYSCAFPVASVNQ